MIQKCCRKQAIFHDCFGEIREVTDCLKWSDKHKSENWWTTCGKSNRRQMSPSWYHVFVARDIRHTHMTVDTNSWFPYILTKCPDTSQNQIFHFFFTEWSIQLQFNAEYSAEKVCYSQIPSVFDIEKSWFHGCWEPQQTIYSSLLSHYQYFVSPIYDRENGFSFYQLNQDWFSAVVKFIIVNFISIMAFLCSIDWNICSDISQNRIFSFSFSEWSIQLQLDADYPLEENQ
jgi:hypothetical protein